MVFIFSYPIAVKVATHPPEINRIYQCINEVDRVCTYLLLLLAIAGAVLFVGLPTKSSKPPSTFSVRLHETPLGGVADFTQNDTSTSEAEVDIASLFTTFVSSASSLAPRHVCVVGPMRIALSWAKMLPPSPSRRTRFLVFPNDTFQEGVLTFDRVDRGGEWSVFLSHVRHLHR